jgi:hypothetical protein
MRTSPVAFTFNLTCSFQEMSALVAHVDRFIADGPKRPTDAERDLRWTRWKRSPQRCQGYQTESRPSTPRCNRDVAGRDWPAGGYLFSMRTLILASSFSLCLGDWLGLRPFLTLRFSRVSIRADAPGSSL